MRVTTEHGSFDAPDGWSHTEGLGAADCAPAELVAPSRVRASLVLTGDVRDASRPVAVYLHAQRAALARVLPAWHDLDGAEPDVTRVPTVTRHAYLPEGALAWVVQYQAWWFEEERVAVLTCTTPSDEATARWDDFARAALSYTPPAHD